MSFVSKYEELSSEVDEIFSTSNTLRIVYEDALKSIIEKVNHRIKQGQIDLNELGPLKALVNVKKESVESSEKKARERLYPQGLILLVSVSEQLLKGLSESLFRDRFLSIQNLRGRKYEITFEEILEKNAEFSKEDFQEKVLESIYGDKNPNEKLNLQNARSIEGVFKSYFGLELDLDSKGLASNLHFYYQIRHLLVHNAGVVDARFIKNLEKAGIGSTFVEGKKIEVSKEMYEDCKEIFRYLIGTIENKISKKK